MGTKEGSFLLMPHIPKGKLLLTVTVKTLIQLAVTTPQPTSIHLKLPQKPNYAL